MNDELTKLLANRVAGKTELETIEIYHPDFTRTFYLVRNLTTGFIAKTEDGVQRNFEYCPMRWERGNSENNLDYDLKITFQDLNILIAPEIYSIPIESEVMPIAVIRSYIYQRDGTIGGIADGPYRLTIRDITFTPEGCAFSASAKPLNRSGSGEIYTFRRFETLKGFVT